MSDKVRKVSVRIADVTYTLVSSEPEAAIQRAVHAAEQLVESIRAANPALNLSASTVLALVNATGDRERLADELTASEAHFADLEAKHAGLRREISGLKEQNNILLLEIKRSRAPVHVPAPAAMPESEAADPGSDDDGDPEKTPPHERHTEGNITFVLDRRILGAEPEVDAPADIDCPAEPEAEKTNGPPRLIQTGIEDLLADD